jgi:hypothetical protein
MRVANAYRDACERYYEEKYENDLLRRLKTSRRFCFPSHFSKMAIVF